MKNYKPILIIFFALFLAYEVNAQCVTPTEDYAATGDVFFCGGTYYLNDTANNGVVIMGINTNSTIRCNGTRFIGNNSGTSIGIQMNTRNNVTVKDCYFANYSYGIHASTGNNCTIINNTFDGVKRGVYGFPSVRPNITNNTFINSSIYLQSAATNLIIAKNYFKCYDKGCGDRTEAILIDGIVAGNIYENYIDTSQHGIYLSTDNYGLNIYSNTIRNADRAIRITDTGVNTAGNATQIYNNIFYNNSNNYDSYNLDIYLDNVSNVYIYNNNFSKSVDVSIIMQTAKNITIINNSFDMVCLNNGIDNRSQYLGNAQNEPCTAIQIKALYKTYCYNGRCINSNSSYTSLIGHNTTNIVIENNSYDNDTNVFIVLQGDVNASVRESGYWYRAIEPVNLIPKSGFYINNNWTEVMNEGRRYNITSGAKTTYEGFNLVGFLNYGIQSNDLYVWHDWTYQNATLAIYNSSRNMSIFNLSYPFNDGYNYSGGNVFFVDVVSSSVNISYGEKLKVGDINCDKHYRDSAIAYSCNTTACYFTNTNCTVKLGRTN